MPTERWVYLPTIHDRVRLTTGVSGRGGRAHRRLIDAQRDLVDGAHRHVEADLLAGPAEGQQPADAVGGEQPTAVRRPGQGPATTGPVRTGRHAGDPDGAGGQVEQMQVEG